MTGLLQKILREEFKHRRVIISRCETAEGFAVWQNCLEEKLSKQTEQAEELSPSGPSMLKKTLEFTLFKVGVLFGGLNREEVIQRLALLY